MKRIKKLIHAVFGIALLALIVSLFSGVISPETSMIPAYLGLAFPAVFLFCLTGMFWFSITSKWGFRISLFIVFLGLIFSSKYYEVRIRSSDVVSGIRVISFNIRGGKTMLEKGDESLSSDQKILRALINNGSDILCLQEMNSRVAEWIEDLPRYKTRVQSGLKGTVIMSDFEVADHGEIDFGTKVNSCIWADLKTPSGTIRVYNAHLRSSRIYDDTEKAINEGKSYDLGVFQSVKKVFGKYEKHSITRVEEARMVNAHMAKSPHPVIFTGDLNESPMSFVYNMFSHHLNDSFTKGSGFGFTFPQQRPLVRIDYIMTSKNLDCARADVLSDIYLSDHLPIVANIILK